MKHRETDRRQSEEVTWCFRRKVSLERWVQLVMGFFWRSTTLYCTNCHRFHFQSNGSAAALLREYIYLHPIQPEQCGFIVLLH